MPPARSDAEGREKLPKPAGGRWRVSWRALIVAAALIVLSVVLYLYAYFNTPYVRTDPSYISNIYRATPSPTAAPSPKPEPPAR